MKRLLCIYGSRTISVDPLNIVKHLFRSFGVTRKDVSALVCGMAPGADESGFIWATGCTYREWRDGGERRIDMVTPIEYRANWKIHGKAAGPIRNRNMVKHLVDEGGLALGYRVPAGMKSTGTDNMTELLEEFDVEHSVVTWSPK